MLRDGEISSDRASQIARAVLRGTATELYHLP